MNKVNNVGLNLINRTIENNQNEGLNSKKDILSLILDCTISNVSISNSESTQLVKSSALKEGL